MNIYYEIYCIVDTAKENYNIKFINQQIKKVFCTKVADLIAVYFIKRTVKITYILNEIIKKAVIRKINLNEISKDVDKLIYHYRENNKDIIKMKEYKNEIEKLERKKSVLYKKKCEQYITTEKFKIEYTRVKEEIEKFENLINEIKNNDGNKRNNEQT